MAVLTKVVAVTDAAPVLVYASTGDNARKTDALIYVDHATNVGYVGGPNVTASGADRGVPVTQDTPLSVSGIQGDNYYMIAAAAAGFDAIVMENGR